MGHLMGRFKGMKGAVIFIILACLVIMYYFYLTNSNEKRIADSKIESTAVQDVLMRNMERNYPPSPKEVVNYFAEITKCFYNESYTEEELEALATRIRELYDDELVANQTDEEYMTALKEDIADFEEKSYRVTNYSLTSSVDVEYPIIEGREYAKLYCMFTVGQGADFKNTNEQFLLRKDGEGHWKIYGWKMAEVKNE